MDTTLVSELRGETIIIEEARRIVTKRNLTIQSITRRFMGATTFELVDENRNVFTKTVEEILAEGEEKEEEEEEQEKDQIQVEEPLDPINIEIQNCYKLRTNAQVTALTFFNKIIRRRFNRALYDEDEMERDVNFLHEASEAFSESLNTIIESMADSKLQEELQDISSTLNLSFEITEKQLDKAYRTKTYDEGKAIQMRIDSAKLASRFVSMVAEHDFTTSITNDDLKELKKQAYVLALASLRGTEFIGYMDVMEGNQMNTSSSSDSSAESR